MDTPLSGVALDEFLARVHNAANAIVCGDMERYADLAGHADVFTLLPPTAVPRLGTSAVPRPCGPRLPSSPTDRLLLSTSRRMHGATRWWLP